jgi:ABC-type amino acid transport substrate-binding protein
MKKITITAFLALSLLLMSPMSVQGDLLADIKSAGKIVVGSDTTYAPFEFIETGATTPVGFDVDFANELATRLGVTAEIKTVVWDTIIPQLQAGEFDVIISAMTINDERDEQIDFSKPYYNSTQAILVADGNPKGIEDETDLDQAGLKIGVQTGTTSDVYITEAEASFTNTVELTRLAAFEDLYQKLDLGEIDVIIGDLPVVGYAAATGAVGGEVAASFGAPEQFGVGIPEGETTLQTAINDALDEMLDDGTYDDIFDCWFGTGACDYKTATDDSGLPLNLNITLVTLSLFAAIMYIRRKL